MGLDDVRVSGVGVERRNGSELLEEVLAVEADVEREGRGSKFRGTGSSSTAGGEMPSSV